MSVSDLSKELIFQTARSSGKGGQHVNKLETMVQVRWNIQTSKLITGEEKEVLLQKLSSKLNKKGELIVSSSEYRTQIENKHKAIEKLHLLVQKALVKRVKRFKTKIPKAVIEHRLNQKKIRSEKKQNRKKWL